MPRRGQKCKCGRHTYNGKRWVLTCEIQIAATMEARDYVRKLFDIRDVQRETGEEARLVEKLLDGRLETLFRVALREIRTQI